MTASVGEGGRKLRLCAEKVGCKPEQLFKKNSTAVLQKTRERTVTPSPPKWTAQRRNQVDMLNKCVHLRPTSALASLADD